MSLEETVKKRISDSYNFAQSRLGLIDPLNSRTVSNLLLTPNSKFEPGQWATLPMRYKILDALPWSKPLFIPLSPVAEEEEFVNRWGLSISDTITLVDAGLVLPSVYTWKHPEEWSNATPKLQPLIERSSVIAFAAESYLESLPSTGLSDDRQKLIFDKLILVPDDLLLSLTHDEPSTPLPARKNYESLRKLRRDLSVAWGARWSYLDRLLNPDETEGLEHLLDVDIRLGIRKLKVLKQINASPITAAIGGDYTWGAVELDRVRNQAIDNSIAFPNERWFQLPTHLRDVITRLSTIHPNPHPDERNIDVKKVIDLASDKELVKKRDMLIDTMEQIGGSWPFDRHSDPEVIVHLLNNFVHERENLADKWINHGCAIATAGIGYIGTGSALSIIMGFAGKPIEILISPFMQRSQEAIRDALLSSDPRHRLVLQARAHLK